MPYRRQLPEICATAAKSETDVSAWVCFDVAPTISLAESRLDEVILRSFCNFRVALVQDGEVDAGVTFSLAEIAEQCERLGHCSG